MFPPDTVEEERVTVTDVVLEVVDAPSPRPRIRVVPSNGVPRRGKQLYRLTAIGMSAAPSGAKGG